MSRIVSNYFTQDTYTAQGTADTRGSRVQVTIHNAAIYIQWQDHGYKRPGSGFYNQEILLPPGAYVMHRRLEGVRVRSAVTGQQAMVTLVVD